MASIFTKIINGTIPSYKIAETEAYYAFLDINPLMQGHTLVVPKKEVDYIFDLDEKTFEGLMRFSKKIAHAIEAVVPCNRISIAVVGLEVPHAHVHLVPINAMADMDFKKPRVQMTRAEFTALAQEINAKFDALND
ncbi:MAG: HIT family protein [Chitinophagales bacterium]